MAQNLSNTLLTPKQASIWAREYLGKRVTSSNILYLLNYGKVANHGDNKAQNLIDKSELKAYYDSTIKSDSSQDSPLSFAKFKESQTTKHIHRIHPYKGKFIPQLVEYFLDTHTDSLKQETYFASGDIVLDPFCGSGTTLCVANELNLHSIGIDISCFNAILSNAKVRRYDLKSLKAMLETLNQRFEAFVADSKISAFEKELDAQLSEFNALYFPAKSYKRQIVVGQIDEKKYAKEKEAMFLATYERLLEKHQIALKIEKQGSFFGKWYIEPIRNELLFMKNEILKNSGDLFEVLMIILSRTARSARATTHADLATLKAPILQSYYCKKHGRVCKPLFSAFKWWKFYAKDTLERLGEFESLRSEKSALCLNADARNVDIFAEVKGHSKAFAEILKAQKIAGIFTSPPYVGLIDYHEQHAYAYDIFDLARKDELEIGKKACGQSKAAQENYTKNIAQVLENAKRFLRHDYNVFLVANDRFNLYPKIANLAGMRIVQRFERPVLNRSDKGIGAYSESVFHLKEGK